MFDNDNECHNQLGFQLDTYGMDLSDTFIDLKIVLHLRNLQLAISHKIHNWIRPITWKLGFSELPIAGGNPPAHISTCQHVTVTVVCGKLM